MNNIFEILKIYQRNYAFTEAANQNYDEDNLENEDQDQDQDDDEEENPEDYEPIEQIPVEDEEAAEYEILNDFN